jgi:hypothetical protein
MAVRLDPAVIVYLRPRSAERHDPALLGEYAQIPVHRTETDAGKIESDLIINTVCRRMAAFKVTNRLENHLALPGVPSVRAFRHDASLFLFVTKTNIYVRVGLSSPG